MERFRVLLFAACGFPSCGKNEHEHANPHAPLFVAQSEGAITFQHASATSGPDPGGVAVFCSPLQRRPSSPQRNIINSALCTFAVTQRSRKKNVSLHLPQFLSLSLSLSAFLLWFKDAAVCDGNNLANLQCFLVFLPLAFVPFSSSAN